MNKLIYLIVFISTILVADTIDTDVYHLVKYKKNYHLSSINIEDNYHFFYSSKSKSCKLSKNSKIIELFDPRFNQEEPKIKSFRCAAFIKEHYSSCKLSNSIFTSSVALSFGKYDVTNLLIGFNVVHPNLDANVDVICKR